MTAGNPICISDDNGEHGAPTAPVLVLEGALLPAGAALVANGRVASVVEMPGGTRAEADLLDAARRAVASAGAAWDDVAAVACGIGPGSFTGLRVALGLAHGLSLGRPGLRGGGASSPLVLAAAAEFAPPCWTAIPWGRLRVMLARLEADGSVGPGARLVARTDLAGLGGFDGEAIVCPVPLDLPAGARAIPLRHSPVEGLARLVARGAVALREGGLPEPAYLVPPDAVLPARAALVPDGYRLVPLGPGDLDDMVRIQATSFDHPWSPHLLSEELRPDPTHVVYGIRAADDALAAVAFGRLEFDALSIFNVAVEPGARRLGLGRALVRTMIARARDANTPRVDLEVRVNNVSAIALYAGEGFVPVGVRKRYYTDGTDALLMSLTLRKS